MNHMAWWVSLSGNIMKSRRPGKRLAVQRVPPKKIGNQSYTLTTNNQTNPIVWSLISAAWSHVKAVGLDELSESSRASAPAKENMWRARGACRQRIAGLLLSTLKSKRSM